MPTIQCAACQRRLKVRDDQLGRRARCPCGAIVALPQPETPAEATDEPLLELPARPTPVTPAALMKQVLSAFQGGFQRPRVTFSYLLALAFVAVFSCGLLLTYFALIAAVGYAVYWHAVNDSIWLQLPAGTPGRARAFVAVGYVFVLLVGVVMFLFLLKPLFARPSRAKLGRKLELMDEPIVHSFVAKLAQVIGAPEPAEIRINSSANAAAAMGEGLRGLFSRRLVLIIGTPLVAGLDAQQFAGVIAHELGHFSQGAGSRISALIRAIQQWLAQGAWGGDEWDKWFSDLADEEIALLLMFAYTCQLAVYVVRVVFFVLLFVSVMASFLLLRQMEYDADRYETLVVGSETFAQTTRKLLPLGIAEAIARNLVANDDAPEDPAGHFASLVMLILKQTPKPVKTALRQHADSARTTWLSTHPSDSDRIRRAECPNAPGIFHIQMPATRLFLNFDDVAKEASPKSYKRMLRARGEFPFIVPNV